MVDWAVKRAGVSTTEVLKRAPPLRDTDGDVVELNYHQIEALASITKAPLGYFFLHEPPKEKLPVPDFRTFADAEINRMSPDLIETVYTMHARQQWYREYVLGEGYAQLGFVGSATLDDRPEALASRISLALGLEEGWASRIRTYGEAVSFVRDLFQENGVLVTINGVVGNNTSRKLNPDEFRGFVLPDEYAPWLFVNGVDAKSAQMFTLFHELAHVWLNRGGIIDIDALAGSSGPVEAFCNRVAANLLVPKDQLEMFWSDADEFESAVAIHARRFKVSPIVIARRLSELDLVADTTYWRYYERYASGRFDEVSASTSDGGNFYNNQNNRIGKKFMRAVARATSEGKLSYTHAFRLTGLTSATFDKYVQAVGA